MTFGEATPDVHAAIDTAHRAKYDQYGANIIGRVVGAAAKSVTVSASTPLGTGRGGRI